MSDMAEILKEHDCGGVELREAADTYICACGIEIEMIENADAASVQINHQSQMLSDAGFGLLRDQKRLMELAALMAYDAIEEGALREAKADAWDEGMRSTVRAVRSGADYPLNPYRAATALGES